MSQLYSVPYSKFILKFCLERKKTKQILVKILPKATSWSSLFFFCFFFFYKILVFIGDVINFLMKAKNLWNTIR